jgi:hypothetical protein
MCNKFNKKSEKRHLFYAISYVAKEMDKDEVNLTYGLMAMQRVPMSSVNYALGDKIYDLMEEYGQDNDLAENWWLYEYDEEEIFLKVYDKLNNL